MNDPDGLSKAIKRLEEDIGTPNSLGLGGKPSFGLGGEMATTGYKPSGALGAPDLPSHVASDQDKFAQILQRMDSLEQRIRRLETPGF